MNRILETLPGSLRTPVMGQLTEYFDIRGDQLAGQIEAFLNFKGDFDSLTLSQIETLAPFFGFSPDTFWRKSWSKTTKAKLLAGVYQPPYIWKNNGSYTTLYYVFGCFGIVAQLSIDGGFIVDLSVVDTDIIAEGTGYLLEVKGLDDSNRFLCEFIMSKFFPIGFKYRTVGV